MTLPADAAAVLFRRILDQTLVGLILVADILSLVTVDTTYFAVNRFDKILGNAIRIPAPHLRSRNASARYR